MPEGFNKCQKEGGRIVTIKPPGRDDVYIHVCYDKDNKAHRGEIHHVDKKKVSADSIDNSYLKRDKDLLNFVETIDSGEFIMKNREITNQEIGWRSEVASILASSNIEELTGNWTSLFNAGLSANDAVINTLYENLGFNNLVSSAGTVMIKKRDAKAFGVHFYHQRNRWLKKRGVMASVLSKVFGMKMEKDYTKANVTLDRFGKTGQVMIPISKPMKIGMFKKIQKERPNGWYWDKMKEQGEGKGDLIFERWENMGVKLWLLAGDRRFYAVFSFPVAKLMVATGYKTLEKMAKSVEEEYRQIMMGQKIVVDLNNDQMADTFIQVRKPSDLDLKMAKALGVEVQDYFLYKHNRKRLDVQKRLKIRIAIEEILGDELKSGRGGIYANIRKYLEFKLGGTRKSIKGGTPKDVIEVEKFILNKAKAA